jgi:ElaB/YqjD/DUF883 family membrane-anchored ribosome-binding protein
MDNENSTKLRIRLGSLELEFEGADSFLRAEVPKLLTAANDLQTVRTNLFVSALTQDVHEAQSARSDMAKLVDEIKSDLDSMSEIGEMESLRLQMAMDRMSKMFSTLSNLLKKIGDTAGQITQNLK